MTIPQADRGASDLPLLNARQRREKMVRDAERDTLEFLKALAEERQKGLVKRRWYEVLKANFG